jgi:peptide/nickel transport system substrate-binding protein
MSCPGSGGRVARGWPISLLALALGGVLTLPGACRQDVSASAAPVRLAIGYADTRKYTNPESGISVIVSLLQDEGLVRNGRNGRAEAVMAERWVSSPDGLTWHFYLRSGSRFHDGTPLDAAVAAASMRRDLNGYGAFAGMRDVTTIEAVGPLELVIHLRRPNSLLLNSLANFPITSPNKASAGAFRLVSRNADSASLEAIRDPARPRSNIDRVDIRLYPSARNAWSAMMRGELDMLHEIAPPALEFVEHSSQTQLKSFLRPYVFTLGFNVRHPVLRSREVRLALNSAVNRDDISKVIFQGRAVPATVHVQPRHWAYDESLPPFSYAPSEAKRLLDAAGLPVKPSTDRRMPSRFRFTCLLPIDDRYERMALMLQRQLVEVGIDMQLEPLPLRALPGRLRSGQYDAYLFEMAGTNLNWTYSFWHSPEPPNPVFLDSGYTGADPALDQLRNARTDEEVRAAVFALQHAMRNDPPAVFLLWNQPVRAVSARFRLPDVGDRDILWTIPQWQLAEPGRLPMPLPSAAAATSP